jgi:hypothetical protein
MIAIDPTPRFRTAWKCLRDHGKSAQDWSFPWWRWRLLGVKAAICVLLGWWEGDPERHDRYDSTNAEHPWTFADHSDIDEISYLWVHTTTSYEYGQGAEFGVMKVAKGWKIWHVHYIESGYP